MIFLRNAPVTLLSYENPNTWSTPTGVNSNQTHTIPHSLGRIPDYIRFTLTANDEVVPWYHFNAAIGNDFQPRGIRVEATTTTSVSVRVFRQNSNGSTFRAKFYALGDVSI